ncbi:Substrate-specific component of predicted ECF transporter [Clostridiaceae bacterium JG1575]|nr:Substrate-specific component of predicted ECF transporter [Clostridiaceae bacterium JG1575]
MKKGLTVKDLVTIGVFAAVYIVAMFLLGLMGMVPLLFLVWPLVNGAISGVIVMLFMAKVPKPWALFFFGIIPPLSMTLMGHSMVVFLHGVVVMALAQWIQSKGTYSSFACNTAANAVFSTWACGSLLQIFLWHDQYIALSSSMMGVEYTKTLEALITWPHMILVYLGALVGGVLGGFLGRAMLKKHFEKAGIV